jgi:uncharacterized membrane protein YphA (DoxX/SURF4 family)
VDFYFVKKNDNRKMNSTDKKIKTLRILYWVSTIVIAVAFFVTGIGNLVPFEHIAQDMSQLGYPPYFLKILGTWKILGALTIVLPIATRFKEWAYAGMMFDLTGAAFSRFFSGGDAIMIIIPLALFSLVIGSRTLLSKGLDLSNPNAL